METSCLGVCERKRKMSSRKIFIILIVCALSSLVLSLWATAVDSRRYAATIAHADSTSVRPIGRAEFVKVDSFDALVGTTNTFERPSLGNKSLSKKLPSSVRFYESGYKKPQLSDWKKAPASTDPCYILPDSMVSKVIFPKCTWENGDVSYLVKINDSTFVILRLPAGRVEANTEFMDKYFTRVK